MSSDKKEHKLLDSRSWLNDEKHHHQKDEQHHVHSDNEHFEIWKNKVNLSDSHDEKLTFYQRYQNKKLNSNSRFKKFNSNQHHEHDQHHVSEKHHRSEESHEDSYDELCKHKDHSHNPWDHHCHPKCEKGEKGNRGEKGEKGRKGDDGHDGHDGCKGEPGDKGKRGCTGPEGPQGPPGERGCRGKRGKPGKTYAETLISVRNPDTTLVIPPADSPEDFDEAVDLVNWTENIYDYIGAFELVSGTYTIPESGDYLFNLTANFRTTVPLNIVPINNLENVPAVQLYDVDTGAVLVSSFLPTSWFTIPLETIPPSTTDIAAILGRGQVNIHAVIPAERCQRIRVRIVRNGLTFDPFDEINPAAITFVSGADTVLSIKKVRNGPIICYTD